jgi:uncharacterized protein
MVLKPRPRWLRRSSGRSSIGRQFRTALLAIVLGVGLWQAGVAAPVSPPWRVDRPWTSARAVVTVGDVPIESEIADTGPLRERGLGYRDGLAPGTGMLFVYDEPGGRTFWMKGMRFCLDIVWIESDRIIGAATDVCPSPGIPDEELPRFQSPEPVRYVLEIPAGWLAAHGCDAGTPITIRLPDRQPPAG